MAVDFSDSYDDSLDSASAAELEELQAERRGKRAYMRQLLAHPDSRDPDYPELEDLDS